MNQNFLHEFIYNNFLNIKFNKVGKLFKVKKNIKFHKMFLSQN